MPNNVGTTDMGNYEGIANAIRELNGSAEMYFPAEMPDAIRALPQQIAGIVHYDMAQDLTEAEQQQARENIDAQQTIIGTEGQVVVVGEDGKVITADMDDTPTAGSTNPVTSEGILSKILATYPTTSAGPSAIVSIDDGADDIPVKSLTVTMDYLAAGYTAVRLFLGDDTARNDIASIVQQGGINGTSGANSGSSSASYNYRCRTINSSKIAVTPSASYRVFSDAERFNAYFYTEAETFIVELASRFYENGAAFTVPANCTKIRLSFTHDTNNTETITPAQVGTVHLCRDAVVRSLPETVYGGTWDVLTGVLTSTLDASGNPLATPATYQLDPADVSTFLGGNKMWSDVGDTALTYRQDISTVLAKLTAAIGG